MSKESAIREATYNRNYWEAVRTVASSLEQGRVYSFTQGGIHAVGIARAFNKDSIRFDLIAAEGQGAERACRTERGKEKGTEAFTVSYVQQSWYRAGLKRSFFCTHFEEVARDELPTFVGMPVKGSAFNKVLNGNSKAKFKGE